MGVWCTTVSIAGEFQLIVGGKQVRLPHSVERVVAYLALVNRPVRRAKLAGTLWIDSPEDRASSNLRTALWRLNRSGERLIQIDAERIALAPGVTVDYRELSEITQVLIDGRGEGALVGVNRLVQAVDLLPDWEDDWVIPPRERYRLLRLEALESAASVFIAAGQLQRGLGIAVAAVATDPLRESARRLVLQIRLLQGNLADAVEEYERYQALLAQEIGLAPSPSLNALIQPHLDLSSHQIRTASP